MHAGLYLSATNPSGPRREEEEEGEGGKEEEGGKGESISEAIRASSNKALGKEIRRSFATARLARPRPKARAHPKMPRKSDEERNPVLGCAAFASCFRCA